MGETNNARYFLGSGSGNGDKLCCSCGQVRAEKAVKKSIKSTFTNLDDLIKFPSMYICDSCLELYNNPDFRFKPIFSDNPGSYVVIERPRALQILSDPPEQYVLSLPYSFKKHHWLFAGISTRETAKIGTDDREVVLDYKQHDIPMIIGEIMEMISLGVPRSEIITGNYSIFTLDKYPFVKNSEALISGLRHCGGVELIVKYTPAVKEKKKYEKQEENLMLTASEINAVNLLSSIAENSVYRMENGMQFWGGFFERRVNRFKELNIKLFAEKLTTAVASKEGIWCNMLKELTEEELEDIMADIRSKTHILIAIVYGERSKNK